MDKNTARQSIKKLRSELSRDEVLQKSQIICEKVLFLEEFKNAKNILAYNDFKNEVSTKYFCKEALNLGKNVFLPVVKGEDIIIGEYNSESFKISGFGIKEPDISRDCIEQSKIDLCIVPGIVFDEKMQRAGFGRGYYDRFFAENNACVKIAFAYDFQVVEELECESHDVPMNIIVTEKRILRG